jgi:hypothetical protein
VQDQIGEPDSRAQVGALEERGGVLGGLLGIDLPADDLAAVDVQDEVEVEEGPAQVGGQIGDVPSKRALAGATRSCSRPSTSISWCGAP